MTANHGGKASGKSKIDPILSAPLPQEKGWINVFKAFNPIGPVAEAYARTLAYRIECKRLDSELERVKAEAQVMNNTIDKAFKIKMEDLKQRGESLNRFYDTVQTVIENLHVERMAVLKMAEACAAKVLAPDTDSESRVLFQQMSIELVKQLPTFGERANDSLDKVVQALPRVAIPEHIFDNLG